MASKNTTGKTRIGLIEGRGIGPFLCDIVEEFLIFVDKLAQKETHQILRDRYPYHSFASIDLALKQGAKSSDISKHDAETLFETLSYWRTEKEVDTVFRASINAEALYRFRTKAEEIKEFCIRTQSGHKVMIIRDQVEGFYANADYKITENEIEFQGRYSREHQARVVQKAIELADKELRKGYAIFGLYKFHLFGNMMKEWFLQSCSSLHLYQPDTGLVELLNNYIFHSNGQKDLLLICSNEVGDLIFELTIGALNLDPKIDLFSRNTLLKQPFSGRFTIYQTIHGSADDLVEENRLESIRPDAALRIAANIAEKKLGYSGIIELTDRGLTMAQLNQKTNRSDIFQIVKDEIKECFKIEREPCSCKHV